MDERGNEYRVNAFGGNCGVSIWTGSILYPDSVIEEQPANAREANARMESRVISSPYSDYSGVALGSAIRRHTGKRK
jgi:hypothetical protein